MYQFPFALLRAVIVPWMGRKGSHGHNTSEREAPSVGAPLILEPSFLLRFFGGRRSARVCRQISKKTFARRSRMTWGGDLFEFSRLWSWSFRKLSAPCSCHEPSRESYSCSCPCSSPFPRSCFYCRSSPWTLTLWKGWSSSAGEPGPYLVLEFAGSPPEAGEEFHHIPQGRSVPLTPVSPLPGRR